ncbi:MAG: uroporphyrinogen decarboxylase family protein [Victivallaceae bacterium]|nr:uroporphyrinogen decarboxylase family protein [Victivallaceae bacterium]
MDTFSKETMLKCIRFESPGFIPMRFMINHSCWNHYDQEALKDLMESHKLLFPNYVRPSGKIAPEYMANARADSPYTDPWGCVWETSEDGITGCVSSHPLESYDNFAGYQMPDPDKTDGTYLVDWEKMRQNVAAQKAKGLLCVLGLPHGHTFLRLTDIRGYEDLLFDMVDDNQNMCELINMVTDFNCEYIMKCLELSPDVCSYPEDLGMQTGPMLSPAFFRKYIKPAYQRIMKPAIDRGCLIRMHSDGDIRTLAEDLIEAGVNVLNLQDMVNGIDWIAEKCAGKVCLDLDIDRQNITRFGTPAQINSLIREEVEKLSSPHGGLMMMYGLYPGIPLENAEAVMDAMEEYMGFNS